MASENARMTELEIQVSHQTAVIEDLSEMVARQDKELRKLEQKVRLLLERAAEDEAGAGGVVLADQKPPHW